MARIFFKLVELAQQAPSKPVAVNYAKSIIGRDRWHVIDHNNFMKISSDCTIRCKDISMILEILKSKTNGSIIVLSGGHGTSNGANYTYNQPINEIVRKADFQDRDLYEDDCKMYRSKRVEIVDMYEISFEQLTEYILGEYHIILAFCYGRNDVAFRMLLNKEPVKTYKLHRFGDWLPVL